MAVNLCRIGLFTCLCIQPGSFPTPYRAISGFGSAHFCNLCSWTEALYNAGVLRLFAYILPAAQVPSFSLHHQILLPILSLIQLCLSCFGCGYHKGHTITHAFHALHGVAGICLHTLASPFIPTLMTPRCLQFWLPFTWSYSCLVECCLEVYFLKFNLLKTDFVFNMEAVYYGFLV